MIEGMEHIADAIDITGHEIKESYMLYYTNKRPSSQSQTKICTFYTSPNFGLLVASSEMNNAYLFQIVIHTLFNPTQNEAIRQFDHDQQPLQLRSSC